MIKALGDIIIAFVALILFMPIIALAMLLILVIDWQNPIFIQPRLGKHKVPFTIIKLRTMKHQQVTFLGKVLRKTGLDELPQLLNILFRQMSFVGPRPLTSADVQRLGWDDEYHSSRWDMKPGITGLAQLSPICHKRMSWFLDKKYTACQSIGLDLKILSLSFFIPFVGKKKAVQWLHSKRTVA